MNKLLKLSSTLLLISCKLAFAQASSIGFKKIQLLDKYISEGASVADVDADGKLDVIAGHLWWKGPDFKESFSYGPVEFKKLKGPGLSAYSNNFFTFPDQLTEDKYADIIKVGLPGSWAEIAFNPGKKPFPANNKHENCEVCTKAQADICNESPQYLDVVGDQRKELLAYSKGHITLASPTNDPQKPWDVFVLSHKDNRRFQKYAHGLGAGDINGDGLQDILEKAGWWEQPKDWDKTSQWKFHAYPFAPQQGGAQMFAYDINGDGKNDVVTSLNAHKYGMAWYEQVSKKGKISFKQHMIMEPNGKPNKYGINFSQLHAMDAADIDGDGILDIVTGKCYYAHNGKDPGAEDPAVLYWFQTVRKADGSAELVPHLIDDNSGVGRQISHADLNGDGKVDIITSNKKGVFVFIQGKAIPGKKPNSSTLPPKSFLTKGPTIRFGYEAKTPMIGWWPKEAMCSAPFTVKDANHKGEKKSKTFKLTASVAAANHAGGVLRVILSKNKDYKAKENLKSWTVTVKPTGSWRSFKTIELGEVTFEKTGKHYLHFIPEKPNREFINLSNVNFKSEEFPAFEIKKDRVRKSNSGGLKEGNAMDAEVLTIEEQLDSFTLPDGFVIELVSSEAQGTAKPISLAFDDAGRMWTQTARTYPADKRHDLFKSTDGKDQIIYFDNPTAREVQTPKIFADGLTMPTSVLPFKDGVYAVHGPDVLYFEDTDNDGKSDIRKTLISGFGIQDTHTGIHQFVRSPGNWITFSQGCNAFGNITLANGTKKPFNRSLIARMKPDGNQVEVIGAGMNNIWAWAQDRQGRVFIHEANDLGYSQIIFDRDATYPSFVNAKRYPDSFFYPPASQGLGLGGTGFCGIAVSDDSSRGFPKEWQKVNFVANPITGAINTVAYDIKPDGSYTFSKKEDLLSSDDAMFRPTAVEFGPDGCLYIIDWYNRIISHNEVRTDHPARDKESGRIWRIRHKSQKPYTPINMTEVANSDLLKHLASGNTWETRAAWHQIVDRKATSLIPELKKILGDKNTGDDIRVHAIWTLEGLGHFDETLWAELLKSSNPNIRHEVVRSLSTLKIAADTAHKLFSASNEKHYYVLNEMVRFFRDTPQKLEQKHIDFLKSLRIADKKMKNEKIKGWKSKPYKLGGSYEPRFLNFLISKALKQDKGQAGFDEAKWNQFIAEAPKLPKAAQKELHHKIEKYTKFARDKKGDVAKGKVHFDGRCAICHDASKGASAFAPALNGGKKRDAEGIITSILDPGAAVEAVFNVYQVTKKDGSTIEGFRSKINEKEITLTFMGGGTLVIPMKDVKSAGYIRNKSVMPAMGAGLTEKDMSDLVEYIQTIE